jgi:hypothetical protein
MTELTAEVAEFLAEVAEKGICAPLRIPRRPLRLAIFWVLVYSRILIQVNSQSTPLEIERFIERAKQAYDERLAEKLEPEHPPRASSKWTDAHFDGFEEFFTATGDVFVASSYSMNLEWLGEQVKIPVAVRRDVKEALLGGEMLKNCVLTIDYKGRFVNIARR